MAGPADADSSELNAYGLFGRAIYDSETEQFLGCIRYSVFWKDATTEDRAFKSAQTFGSALVVLTTIASAIGIRTQLFTTSGSRCWWIILRLIFTLALLSELFVFSVWRTKICDQFNGEKFQCVAGTGGAIGFLNAFILLLLTAISCCVPPPANPMYRAWTSNSIEEDYETDDVDFDMEDHVLSRIEEADSAGEFEEIQLDTVEKPSFELSVTNPGNSASKGASPVTVPANSQAGSTTGSSIPTTFGESVQSAKKSTAYFEGIQTDPFRYEPHGYLSPTNVQKNADEIAEGHTEQEVEYQETNEAPDFTPSASVGKPEQAHETSKSSHASKTGQPRVAKDAPSINKSSNNHKREAIRTVKKQEQPNSTKSKQSGKPSSVKKQKQPKTSVEAIHSRNRRSKGGMDPPSGAASIVSSIAEGIFPKKRLPVTQILTSRTETKDDMNRVVIVEEFASPTFSKSAGNKQKDIVPPRNPEGTELVKVRTEYGPRGIKTIKDVTHCDGSRTVTTTIDQPDINNNGVELTFDEDDNKLTATK